MALVKAVIVPMDTPQKVPIPVMFNPPNYELSKTNQFAEIKIPGLPSSVLQFVHGDSKSLSMELFFDTSDTGVDVRTRTLAISNLTEPNPITRAPPRLLLLWGSLAFSCFLISVRQQFEYFSSTGAPQRARLTVQFKGYDPLESLVAANPAAQLAQLSLHIAKASDTLQSVANNVFKDPAKWRDIATANNIDNPRSLVAGVRLKIPGLG